MHDGLLPHFEVGVFSEGFKLKPYKLFAEVFAEESSHFTEQLDCNHSVLLIRIIMGHLQDVLKHTFASTIDLYQICNIRQAVSSLFLDI